MIDIIVRPDVWLRLRETPWDARALGRSTLDLVDCALAAETGGAAADDDELFSRLDGFGAGLVTARIAADRRVAAARFQAAGFRQVETVYRLAFANLARFTPKSRLRPLPLRPARPADRPALIAQAADSFHYGRFAEDPAIAAEINKSRQIDWMEGLLAGRARVLVADFDGEPAAFMALTTEGETAELVLAGTRPAAAALALPLWTAVLTLLREEGIRRVSTTISAANLGVVNLYASLGFRFEQALVGLHLHRP